MFNCNQTLETTGKQINWFKAVSIFLLVQLVWIVMFIDGKKGAELSWHLQNKGVTISGTVVKIHYGRRLHTWPEVAFEVNGKTYTFEFRNRMRRYELGEQVMVRYDPADPNIAQIDSTERWKYPAFEISFAMFIMAFYNSLMIWALLKRRRRARLLAHSYRSPE